MIERFDHVALYSRDLEKSIAFYEEMLGFKLYARTKTASGLNVVYLKRSDCVLELIDMPSAQPRQEAPDPVAGLNHFCFVIKGFDEEVERWKRGGVEMLQPPHPTPARVAAEEGWMRVTFLGPEGETIELRGK